MKRQFSITVDVPSDCDPHEVAGYLHTAIESWRGGGDPDDWIFAHPINTRVAYVADGARHVVDSDTRETPKVK